MIRRTGGDFRRQLRHNMTRFREEHKEEENVRAVPTDRLPAPAETRAIHPSSSPPGPAASSTVCSAGWMPST